MHFDVIIVGGGLAGLSLARALRDTRLSVALIENHPPRRPAGWDARVYALTPANAAFLAELGAWAHLDANRIAPLRAMQVRGDAGGELEFSAYECGVSELGWILEASLMACELWESVRRQDRLTLLSPSTPQALAFSPEAAELTLADGRRVSASLLVGADGRDSWVRREAGLVARNAPYGEMGVVANFTCARPHRGIARQWFRADGVLAWLPLSDADGINRISIVWSTPDAHAAELLALPPEELCARVVAAGGGVLGDFEPLTPAAAFPLRLMQVPQVVAPRLALIGDAAHGIHPLSGHGINLGFQDARVLAGLLAETPAWEDVGQLRRLQAYQRARREETVLMQETTDMLRRLFRERLPFLPALRNAGLSLTNALPPLKNRLARYAMGLV